MDVERPKVGYCQQYLFPELLDDLRRGARGEGTSQPLSLEVSQAFTAPSRDRALALDLMEEVIRPENLNRAYQRVLRNRGAPGVDGMTVGELKVWFRQHQEDLIASLGDGSYRPQPVLGVLIPKPGGSGMRQLGIPTVVDRFVQQAILQVLEPILDPTFSASSFGFRRGRGAHQALAQANRYVSEGREIVVDLDLEKFFDRVNHDILMSRLARRIDDKRLLHILRRFLTAGMMQDGVCVDRNEGTPQGGPLSPLLANLLLDDLDKELERRGHCFCRYADDCNIYVESQAAGERVMASVTRFLEGRLRLRVNRHKSAVARVNERKFLGYRLLGNGRLGVAPASLERAKARIRILTRRNQGRRFAVVIGKLNAFLVGWVNYFRHAQCRAHLIALEGWIRRRLRCYRLKQRKRRYGIVTFLMGLRLSAHDAWQVAKSSMGWWPMSGDVRVARTLSLRWFRNEGLLSLTERYDALRLQ